MTALDLTNPLPPSVGALARWTAEPVKHIWLPASSFISNGKGYPVLSKACQAFLKGMTKVRTRIRAILLILVQPTWDPAEEIAIPNLHPRRDSNQPSLRRRSFRISPIRPTHHLSGPSPSSALISHRPEIRRTRLRCRLCRLSSSAITASDG